MFSKIALESLSQRGRTPLFNDLVSLFTDVQNVLQTPSKGSRRQVSLLDTLKQMKFASKLGTIVTDRTGIPIKDVTIYEMGDPNLFALLLPTASAYSSMRKKKISPGMAMDTINKLYDDKKAKLALPKDFQFAYTFSFGFTTGLWQVKNKDGSFYFTPEEVAAGVLHEIGHHDQFIRGAVRIYGDMLDASDIVEYLNDGPDITVVKELVARLKQSRMFNRQWAAVLDVVEKNLSDDKVNHPEAITMLAAVFTSEISSNMASEITGIMGNATTKVKTRLQEIDPERSADEFASRNGAYKDLVSLLRKFSALGEGQKSSLVLRPMIGTLPAMVVSVLIRFTSYFGVGAEDIAHGYDPIIRRMSLIVETAKHAFQDDHLPKEVADDIKKQILEAEKYIDEYKSQKHVKVRQTINNWLINVNKFGRVIAAPFYSRTSQDYERLQNATRALSRNPLYYMAKK